MVIRFHGRQDAQKKPVSKRSHLMQVATVGQTPRPNRIDLPRPWQKGKWRLAGQRSTVSTR